MEKKTYALYMRFAERLRFLIWGNNRGARRIGLTVAADVMSHYLGRASKVILEAPTTSGPMTVVAWYGPYTSATVASAVSYAEERGLPFDNHIHAQKAFEKLVRELEAAIGARPSDATIWSAWTDQVARRETTRR